MLMDDLHRIVRKISDVTSPNEEHLPKSLYHYTTIEGLYGIVRSRKFWASHIGMMNDREEIVDAARIAYQVLQGIERSGASPAQQSFLDLALRLTESIKEGNMLLDPTLQRMVNIFVISFSDKADLLSQWRGYSSGSTPICIEFDFKKLCKSRVADDVQPIFMPYNVIYDRADKQKVMEQLVDELYSYLAEHSQMGVGEATTITLFTHFPQFKNEAFREEGEWRYIYAYTRLPYQLQQKQLRREFRIRNGLIVPYVEVELENSWPVKSLIVGPTKVQEQVVYESLDYFLSQQTNEFKGLPIEPSNIPYRE